MPITASLMQHQEDRLSNLQQLMVRTALGCGRFGILPGCECHTDAAFVNRKYEMTGLRLTLMLPSGCIIDVDSDMELEIPHISAGEVFVTIGIAEGMEYTFEQDGIPFVMPQYKLEMHTLAEMEALDVVPLKRMVMNNGILNVDTAYIMPTLTIGGDSRYMDYIGRYIDSISALIKHPNMADDEGWSCKRNLLQLLFQLKRITDRNATSDLTDLLHDIASTVDFFIVEEMGAATNKVPEKVTRLYGDPRRDMSIYNIASFMTWLGEYLEALPMVMDLVTLTDHTIDTNALKEEIKTEVTTGLMTMLEERMAQMHNQLTEELTSRIMATITDHINGSVKPEIVSEVLSQLRNPLYQELYDALMDALSGFVSRPQDVEEDAFMPII